MDKKLEKYNENLSGRWSKQSTELNAELFFGLCKTIDEKAEVFLLWDNAIGNVTLLDYLKQIVAMLEKNKDTNYSTNQQSKTKNNGTN